MQYIVKIKEKGKTAEEQFFPIKAKTKNDALTKAKNLIAKKYNLDGISTYISAPISNGTRMILSFVLMGIALVLLCMNYTQVKAGFLGLSIFSKTIEINFMPELFECVFAVFFYATYAYRIKGFENSFKSLFDILQCVLFILLMAGMFKMITYKNMFLNLIDSRVFIGICILFCLLSIKPFNVYFTLITMMFSLIRISDVSEIMGIRGALFIISAFLGIALNISVDPYLCRNLPNFFKSASYKYEEFKLDTQDVAYDNIMAIKHATTFYNRGETSNNEEA